MLVENLFIPVLKYIHDYISCEYAVIFFLEVKVELKPASSTTVQIIMLTSWLPRPPVPAWIDVVPVFVGVSTKHEPAGVTEVKLPMGASNKSC